MREERRKKAKATSERVKPFVYNTHRRVYDAIGDVVGPAFEMGKAIGG